MTTPAPVSSKQKPGQARPAPKPLPTPKDLYDRAAAQGQRILMAEFILCLAIVAVRFAADFSDRGQAGAVARSNTPPGSKRGADVPQSGTSPHGGKGPLSVLGGVLAVFFVLSLLPWRRVSAAAGGIVTVALLMNSESQFHGLAAGLKAGPQQPPPASTSSGSRSAPPAGSGNPVQPGPGNSCPAGYYYDPIFKLCVAGVSPGPPET